MDQWDRDELELGRRAATWQLHDELGQLYPELEDRAWNVVIGCYGLLCDLPATRVIIYGCLNQHLKERYPCNLPAYQAVITTHTCDQCGEPWAEQMTSLLSAANAPGQPSTSSSTDA